MAEFTGAEFDGQADFFNCHFASRAVFNGRAQFNGDALFQDACFEDVADFEDVIFKGDANFSAPSELLRGQAPELLPVDWSDTPDTRSV